MTTKEFYIKNWNNFSDDIKHSILKISIYDYNLPVVSSYHHDVKYYPCIKEHRIKPLKYGYAHSFNKETNKLVTLLDNTKWSNKQKQTVYIYSFKDLSIQQQLDLAIQKLNLKPINEIKLENL